MTHHDNSPGAYCIPSVGVLQLNKRPAQAGRTGRAILYGSVPVANSGESPRTSARPSLVSPSSAPIPGNRLSAGKPLAMRTRWPLQMR